MSGLQAQFLVAATIAACQTEPAARYDVAVVTSEQLSAQARAACEAARGTGKPVLLEFGAPWCPDCQAVAGLRATESFVEELEQWVPLFVNVGRFDQHAALRERFGVQAIATWVALVPPDACSAPVDTWTRVRTRTVEPTQGDGQTALSWLKQTRAKAASTPPAGAGGGDSNPP